MPKLYILVDAYSRNCIASSFTNNSFKDLKVVNEFMDCVKLDQNEEKIILVMTPSIRNNADTIFSIRLVSNLYGIKTVIATDEFDIDSTTNFGSNSVVVKSTLEQLEYSDIIGLINLADDNRSKRIEPLDINRYTAEHLLDKGDPRLHSIMREYLSLKSMLLNSNIDLELAKSKLTSLEAVNQRLEDNNKELQKHMSSMVKKSIQVNNALTEYQVIFSNDKFTKVDCTGFNSAPSILYLKYQSHLENLNSLIDTLYSTFTVQEKISTKVIRIYDSKGCKSILTLPKKYKRVEPVFNGNEVIQHDFICKYGDYKSILSLLLQNKTNLNLLIVVDCREYSDTILTGSYPIYNLCGDPNFLSLLSLSEDNTIVNSSEGTLAWDNFKEVDKLQTASEKLTFLSSRKCITEIVSSVRINIRNKIK